MTPREAVKHYERHVLAWYALGRVTEARAARAAITLHQPAGSARRRVPRARILTSYAEFEVDLQPSAVTDVR